MGSCRIGRRVGLKGYSLEDVIAIAELVQASPSLRTPYKDKTNLRRVALPDFHISISTPTVLSNQSFSTWRAPAGDFLPAKPSHHSPIMVDIWRIFSKSLFRTYRPSIPHRLP